MLTGGMLMQRNNSYVINADFPLRDSWSYTKPSAPQPPAPALPAALPVATAEPEIPQPELPAPLRATTPHLWSHCVLPEVSDDGKPEFCNWDDGFPAISKDGSLIAFFDDGRSIRWISASTAATVGVAQLVSSDEYNNSEGFTHRERIQRRVDARVARVQHLLDARGFRSLQSLGTFDARNEQSDESPGTKNIYAEFSANGETRVINPLTSSVLWQGNLQSRSSEPLASVIRLCPERNFWFASMWWDPTSYRAIALLDFETAEDAKGVHACASVQVPQVFKFAKM
jgi:hypothetical protein